MSIVKSRLLQLERLLARLRRSWNIRHRPPGELYVQGRVSEYREIWRAVAEEVGAQFDFISEDIWELSLGENRTKIANYKLQFDDPVVLEMAGRKPFVYRLLRERGLRVPEHEIFQLGDLDKAEAFLARQPKGCVVKPANGTASGLGVTTHVFARRELRRAAILASLYDSQLLIEKMIPGESYRLLVLDGKVIHAVRRRSPRLEGDGTSTVAELIRAENKRLMARGQTVIGTDRDCCFTLDYQNLSLSSIPREGQRFAVQSVNDPEQRREEVRTVYDESVSDLLCEALREDAESAADRLGARFIGVDVITPDPTVPLEQSGGAIIELNTTPGLHHHYDMRREKYPKPALRVLRALLDG